MKAKLSAEVGGDRGLSCPGWAYECYQHRDRVECVRAVMSGCEERKEIRRWWAKFCFEDLEAARKVVQRCSYVEEDGDYDGQ